VGIHAGCRSTCEIGFCDGLGPVLALCRFQCDGRRWRLMGERQSGIRTTGNVPFSFRAGNVVRQWLITEEGRADTAHTRTADVAQESRLWEMRHSRADRTFAYVCLEKTEGRRRNWERTIRDHKRPKYAQLSALY
jgi:hypothetical protein